MVSGASTLSMKRTIKIAVTLVLALACIGSVFAQGAKKPVTIEMWYGAAITEAGPPPDDWVVYKILKDKFGIELKITAEPSNENDQDVKVLAAAAANQLPDLFMQSPKRSVRPAPLQRRALSLMSGGRSASPILRASLA